MEVNIYIETSTQAPKVLRASGIYVMEALQDGKPVMANGEPVIVYEQTEFTHTNVNIMTLTLLEAALKRLQKPCKVNIHTKCETVYWTLKNRWIDAWKENGWKTAKGLGIKNGDMWKKIEYLLNKNEWTVSHEDHTWERWMREKLKENGGQRNVG